MRHIKVRQSLILFNLSDNIIIFTVECKIKPLKQIILSINKLYAHLYVNIKFLYRSDSGDSIMLQTNLRTVIKTLKAGISVRYRQKP